MLGRERLERGDPRGAILHFTRALDGSKDISLARRGLAISYALCGRMGELRQLVAACHPTPVGRLQFLHTMLLELLEGGAWSVISAIAGTFTDDAHLRAISIYYAGCVELFKGNHDAAWTCIAEFKSIVIPRHREFPIDGDEDFNLVVRQACLIEPPDRVAELVAAPASTPATPAVSITGDWCEPGTDDPILLCCCDRRYFRRFAGELCQSVAAVRPDATLHFHLAAPGDADLERARALAGTHRSMTLNVTVEQSPLFTQPVYYTCNRFLVAPLLLQRYRRPLLMLDADSALLNDLAAIVDAARGFDFACFNSGRVEPASMFQAGLMYFAPSPGALRLLEILGRLVLAKLALPPVLSWMLDQAALYSAIRYVEKHAPEIGICNLTAATGRHMRDFVGGLGTREEKLELMSRTTTP